nr:DNA topoisomerase [Fructilactobacillus florum]
MEEGQKKGLSAGRVQSVALWIIIQREREIKAFQPEEYWTITSEFKKGRSKFQAAFYGLNGKRKKIKKIMKTCKKVLQKLTRQADFQITDVKKTEKKRQPPRPYTTSTMQQDANKKIEVSNRSNNDGRPATIRRD